MRVATSLEHQRLNDVCCAHTVFLAVADLLHTRLPTPDTQCAGGRCAQLRFALEQGGLVDFPNHEPHLSYIRTLYAEFYAMLESGVVEGVVPVRRPAQYYASAQGLKLRSTLAKRRSRRQNAGGRGRGGPGQGGGEEQDEAAQE